MCKGEEIANSITHAIGLGLSVAVLVLLVVWTSRYGDAWQIVSVSIFGATLVLLYLTSTLLHSYAIFRERDLLEVLDRTAIYWLIAGTYTPFMLTALRGGWGWSIAGTVWALALFGTLFVLFSKKRFSNASCILYLLMGWLIVIAIVPAVQNLPLAGLLWLLAGGLAYSGGVFFFLSPKRFRHTLWHCAVLSGSACHVLALVIVLQS
jgi:hemolysin III